MKIMNMTKYADNIADLICTELKDFDIQKDIVYNGKSISIKNKIDEEPYLFIWCRLMWDYEHIENPKCKFYISTITIDENMHRRGIFTSIINKLKTCKYIDNIIIQSVCSKEMYNWCIKNRFIQCETIGDFSWKA